MVSSLDQAQRLAQNIAAQRDRAMNESAMLATHLETERIKREAAFTAISECIRSGQIAQEDAPAVVAGVPGLQDWLDERERTRLKEEARSAPPAPAAPAAT